MSIGRRRDRGTVQVLVPGCGLGRLAMEIAAKGEPSTLRGCPGAESGSGFASQGNEFSAYMLIASNFILNK